MNWLLSNLFLQNILYTFIYLAIIFSNQNAQRKIMGGLDAGYGQFPWTAHIKIRGPNIDKVCGGTLVNMRWVITAGHCTQYCQDVPHCLGEISQAGNLPQPELNSQSEFFYPKTNYETKVKKNPTYSSIALCLAVLSKLLNVQLIYLTCLILTYMYRKVTLPFH